MTLGRAVAGRYLGELPVRFRAKQILGKYRIQKRLAEGGFAEVYRALDTIEGIPVALKVPHDHMVTDELLEDFRGEVRLTAKLDHPNVLSVKNAEFIEGHFAVVYPLGDGTLEERLQTQDVVRRQGRPGRADAPRRWRTRTPTGLSTAT